MRLTGRQLSLGGLVLAVLLLLTFFLAPQQNQNASGSTFSRDPDGYGAWYAWMSEQGTPIQRWQRSLQDLPQTDQIQTPATLLRVHSARATPWLTPSLRQWVSQGNTLVVLGVKAPATAAPFSTIQNSPVGPVQIETRRRASVPREAETQLLGDRFGAMVWQEPVGQGQVIWSTVPYLAANAYQEQSANFAFLAEIVTQNGGEIWVDEYLHGYKTPEAIAQESGIETWAGYLAQTPWLVVLVQGAVGLLVLFYAQNRRFGTLKPLDQPTINNSEAYIQALAGVLHKAESHSFVVEAIRQAEQRQLQKALGLGSAPVEEALLLQAWTQHTGRSATDLQQALFAIRQQPRLSESELQQWLLRLEAIRQNIQASESKVSPAMPRSRSKVS